MIALVSPQGYRREQKRERERKIRYIREYHSHLGKKKKIRSIVVSSREIAMSPNLREIPSQYEFSSKLLASKES